MYHHDLTEKVGTGQYITTPLGAGVTELATCRGWLFQEAVDLLEDRFENDRQCPVSGMFTAYQVMEFYSDRGIAINPVPLPRR